MKAKSIYFIGIGGCGMSGLAEIFHSHGYNVQGSDIKKTKITERLESKGICVKRGHSAENIDGVDYVVYSSCITKENIEMKEAKKRGIPILRRIEALNMLVGDKDIVAVSGAHGKTTTTSLVSFLLIRAGLDPTVFIGADVDFLEGNSRYGRSDLVVTEADESDGSFLLLNPLYSVATNIDKEHMDYYADMDEVMAAYNGFIENTKEGGASFICSDDHNLRSIAKNSSKKIVTYGVSQGADIRACNIEVMGLDGSRFDFVFKDNLLGRIHLSIRGMHNILNSLAAIGVTLNLGVDFSFIKKVIADFKGADRRFVVNRLDSDILVIDDYAHHPTEIKATLKTLENSGRRIVVVFQPHRYSRTKYLKEEFSSSFALADYLVVTGIYAAHEKPIDGVSAEDICAGARKYGHRDAYFVPRNDIIKHLSQAVRPHDAVFILGAGDIGELYREIVKTLKGIKKGDDKT